MTSEFPKYTLRQLVSLGACVKVSVVKSVREKVPKMPKRVDGETDILLGMKYAKYFPELIHMFPSGFAVYRSAFLS